MVINDLACADWIAERAGCVFNPRCDVSFCNVDEWGRPRGGVIFNGYTGNAIFIHIAGDGGNFGTRDLLWVSFHYPFVQMGVEKLYGTVPSWNQIALDFDYKLGFELEAVLKGAVPGGDMMILSMTRESCRWLKIKPRNLRVPLNNHVTKAA